MLKAVHLKLIVPALMAIMLASMLIVFSANHANAATLKLTAARTSVAASNKSLTLSWNAIKGSAGYRVSWRSHAMKAGKPTAAWAKQWSGLKRIKTSVRAYKASGLINGRKYQIRLESKTKANKPRWTVKSTLTATPNPTAPEAPTNVIGVAGDGQVTVSWKDPSNNGGSVITSYRVVASTTNSTGQSCTAQGQAASACTVTGLANEIPYTFIVTAINGVGERPSIASAPVTPYSVLGAPTNVTALAGNTSAEVSWAAPANNGGSAITGYKVTTVGGGGGCTTTTLSCTVVALSNGADYAFTVRVANARGNFAASVASSLVRPFGLPGAPTNVTASAGNTSAEVSWSAPADNGGSAITGYTVTTVGGGGGCTTTTLSCTVFALSNGADYAFTVRAANARGNSAASVASSLVRPFGLPGAPTNVTASAGNTSAEVSWAAPADNGGSVIIGYTVIASTGGAKITKSCSSSPCTVSSLSNVTAYTFTVKATNARGDSAESTDSNAVIPLSFGVQPDNPDLPTGNSPLRPESLFAELLPQLIATPAVNAPDLTEASGLAESALNPGVYWTHNDSGDRARLFAIDAATGALRATFELPGVTATDWEDLAIAPDADGNDAFYIADIGDNGAARSSVKIYRTAEPALPAAGGPAVTINAGAVSSQRLTYPGGPRDAESLAVGADGALTIISKREAQVGVYRLPAPQFNGGISVLSSVGQLPLTWVVGASASQDGSFVLIKTSSSVLGYAIASDESVAEALVRGGGGENLPYSAEPQGESVAAALAGRGHATISEGISQPLQQWRW